MIFKAAFVSIVSAWGFIQTLGGRMRIKFTNRNDLTIKGLLFFRRIELKIVPMQQSPVTGNMSHESIE